MSQQGDAHGSQEEDWWRQLYDEEAVGGPPAGPPSSIDAHFDSAVDAMTPPPAPRTETLRLRRPTAPPPPPSWPQPTRPAPPAPRRPESDRAAPAGWDPWAAAPTFSGPAEGAAEAEQPGPVRRGPRAEQVPSAVPAEAAAPAPRDAVGELAAPAEDLVPVERREVPEAPEFSEVGEVVEVYGWAERDTAPPEGGTAARETGPVVPAQPPAVPEAVVRGGAVEEWSAPVGPGAGDSGPAAPAAPPLPTVPPVAEPAVESEPVVEESEPVPVAEPAVEPAPESAAAAQPLPWDVWNSEPTFGGASSGPRSGPAPTPVPEAAAEPDPEPVSGAEPEPDPVAESVREPAPAFDNAPGAVLRTEGVEDAPPAKPWDAWVSPRPLSGSAPSPAAPTAPPPAERWGSPAPTPVPAPAPEPVSDAPAEPPAVAEVAERWGSPAPVSAPLPAPEPVPDAPAEPPAAQLPAPVPDPRTQLPPRPVLFHKEEPPRPPAPAELEPAPEPVPWSAAVPVPVPPTGSAEWAETAFGEGGVRWAPELPPGWVAAGEDVAEVEVVGDGPPTYGAEPTAWPETDPDALDGLVADTVLDGAAYGSMTLRTVAIRGDSARYRGHPRRDALLTARFGSGDDALLLVAMASGARAADDAHRAAQDAVRWIAGAVGRSRARLADDMRGARRGSLKSGLHRLTDRCYGRLRARGEDLGLDEGTYTASVRCLLLPADPQCRIRLFFGVGEGGLFRIRDGAWQDLDLAPDETAAPFRFRATVAQPGDALLMCSAGLAEPLRGEPQLAAHLAQRWGAGRVPGLAGYLADAQTRVKGYADDRTAVTVWDA